jgi:hypothetical protein
VTGYTNARISWLKGHLAESRGQPGLVVDDELARALHNESRAAVAYWWGLARSTITRWRIRLGVNRYNAGSKRLQLNNSEKGADAIRGVVLLTKRWSVAGGQRWNRVLGRPTGMAVLGHGRTRNLPYKDPPAG